MKTRLKKIGVLQTAKVAAMLYLVTTAVIFEPMALIALSSRRYGITPSSASGYARMNPLFLMLMPIFYCIIGFVFAALSCWLYNFIAKKIGGIEIELDQEQSED